ncbi:MAG: hypothetical protein Q8Q09_10160 [Deltaproteobacteria bacterium]|nr:hypothetical protein [Deltaproteobacteria bacterium]
MRHAFHAVQRALDHALIDERLASNPSKVVRRHLPAVEDKDPSERQDWIFSRSEIAALKSFLRVIDVRRMIYAIAFTLDCPSRDTAQRAPDAADPRTFKGGRELVVSDSARGVWGGHRKRCGGEP